MIGEPLPEIFSLLGSGRPDERAWRLFAFEDAIDLASALFRKVGELMVEEREELKASRRVMKCPNSQKPLLLPHDAFWKRDCETKWLGCLEGGLTPTRMGRTAESFLMFFLAYLCLAGRCMSAARSGSTAFGEIDRGAERCKIDCVICDGSVNENLQSCVGERRVPSTCSESLQGGREAERKARCENG